MRVKLKFWIKIEKNRIQVNESIQFTKIVELCEMNETFYNQGVEEEFLAWFHFIKDEDKALCQLDNTAL